MNTNRQPVRAAGFTLIELMVVIVIGAILLAIAAPAYQAQIRKSRRVEAKNALLDLAAREERFFSVANAYTNDPASLGYPAGSFGGGTTIGSGYYTLDAPVVTAGNPAVVPPVQPAYQLTARATGIQLKDSGCRSFTLNQLGQQSSTDSGGTSTAGTASQCWN